MLGTKQTHVFCSGTTGRLVDERLVQARHGIVRACDRAVYSTWKYYSAPG